MSVSSAGRWAERDRRAGQADATHFPTKRLLNVAAEMASHVFAFNATREMNVLARPGVLSAIRAA